MVTCTCVRGSTLARLAMVLVWQRAVNRQPGSRSDNSLSRRLPRKKLKNKFSKFSKFQQKMSTFEMSRVNRTFPWHHHFSTLLALSKSSIHYLKQSCYFQDHFSMIFFPKTKFLWSRAPACAAPLWPA